MLMFLGVCWLLKVRVSAASRYLVRFSPRPPFFHQKMALFNYSYSRAPCPTKTARYRHGVVFPQGFHSAASFSASPTCSGVMRSAMLARFFFAPSFP
jgi:hypothetical protein